MRRSLWLFWIVAAVVGLSACGSEDDHGHHGHHDHSHDTVPAAYSGLQNPSEGEQAAIDSGGQIWVTYCANCHGAQGDGQGAVAAQLTPPPPALNDARVLDSMSDGYLFWILTEGAMSGQVSSSMPAYGETLSDPELWAVISFLRTLPE